MTKRTESNTPSKKRRDLKRNATKRRRMMLEGLEQRQLLAAQVVELPSVTLPVLEQSRDIGTVEALAFSESEIDLTGSLPFTTVRPPISLPDGTIVPQTFSADLDFFAFDLRAGDILDIATLSAAGSFTVYNPDGSVWYAITDNQSIGGYPAESPLQTLGNAVYAQGVPEDGRYTVAIAPNNVQSSYTVGLRVYRPVVESLPIGAQQYVFLDLDGGIYSQTVLNDFTGIPQVEVFRIPSLQESLPVLGLLATDTVSLNRLIDLTLVETERQFDFLGLNGNAGDFDRTGVAGDYGITILNSRDHVDPGNHPLVTRVAVGGVAGDINGPPGLFGISETIDVGNFGMSDTVFTVFDGLAISAALGVPISPSASVLEAAADLTALTISHELGHSFGLRHTLRANTIVSVIDGQVDDAQDLGVGVDGIYGSPDDVNVDFIDDLFDPAEGILGTNFVTNSLANTLVTGTVGSNVSGVVFNDLNSDGNNSNDAGLAGVTVFIDSNGDGLLTPGETSTVSGADGSFTLSAANGSASVVAIAPEQFASTTPSSVAANFGSSGTALAFGFAQVIPDITGTKFADLNDNGLFDANETGIGGVYIYLDLDGDDRPDLGEPAGVTAADGTYSINFPGAGTYTIREVLEPGFRQTFPVGGEHTVTFDGSTLGNNYNFGNSPSRDFGDAPDDGALNNYRTLTANDGASHGLVNGLSLGTIVDRDVDGAQSADAMGDDLVGTILLDGSTQNDEDGVEFASSISVNPDPADPLANTIQVTTTNETGTAAYLQAWIDFDGNGDFDGANEQIATNMLLGTGTINLPVTVPANAATGATYARFRYSQEQDLDWFGATNTGEVEDYLLAVRPSGETAVADSITVSRNSLAQNLTSQILDNDFSTPNNPITITAVQDEAVPNSLTIPVTERRFSDTIGTVVLNNGQVSYTPRNGFIGLDRFAYTISDTEGNESTAIVTVNVTFLSSVPIAVDDIFLIPEGGAINRALNVLDNDVPSTAGGLSIISVQPGDNGGAISPVGGGQSIRYTPAPGFNGTEQFVYNVQDASGQISSATVTVNVLPGSRTDDIVDFRIETLDSDGQPQSNFRVGDTIQVRVSVEDLQFPEDGNPNFPFLGNQDGVASAFLDLLYTDTQVAVRAADASSTIPFDFDITFGELFNGFVGTTSGNSNPDAQGSSRVPGLLNEIGAFQTANPNIEHNGPVTLFTVTMEAIAPGIAIFQGDPANNTVSETITVGSTEILTPSQLRFGFAEVEIFENDKVLSAAIDDSFPDNVDSLGQRFDDTGVSTYRLNVLENDFLGFEVNASGDEVPRTIIDRQILAQGGFGEASFNDNGTPDDLGDDFIDYVPNIGASGFESFTYFIVTDDGVRSVAEATLAIDDDANDDVDINFVLVDTDGNPLNLATGVTQGQTFGVQVNLKDIRPDTILNTSVFAGYLDVLYSSDLIKPANTTTPDRNQVSQEFFNFDVTFQVDGETGFNVGAAVGSATNPGIINEFGAFLIQDVAENLTAENGNLMATIFFEAIASGTARVVGSPADSFPFQDTLLSRENDPVPVDRIRYDVLEFNITGPSGEFIQNTARPADVNNDGHLSPLDALLVMNRLALEAANAQGEDAPNNTHFLDVSGEGDLSPLDALMVLNALSDARAESFANSGQGELVSDSLGLAEDVSTARVRDAEVSDSIFTELDQRPVFGSTTGSDSAPAASPQLASFDSSSDDNEDDELLNLLADDLSDLEN